MGKAGGGGEGWYRGGAGRVSDLQGLCKRGERGRRGGGVGSGVVGGSQEVWQGGS